jgi:hypothetical protein
MRESLPVLVQRHRAAILELASRHGATNVRVFGSVMRGEATDSSDLDLLVDMEAGRSLIDRIALKQELETLIGCPVDVVGTRALHWSIREQVLAEARPL